MYYDIAGFDAGFKLYRGVVFYGYVKRKVINKTSLATTAV